MTIAIPSEVQRWMEYCAEARIWNRTKPAEAVPLLRLEDFVRPSEVAHQTLPGRMTFTVLERD